MAMAMVTVTAMVMAMKVNKLLINRKTNNKKL